MKLNKQEVLNLAKLAKLKLTDQEVNMYQQQLTEVLGYVDKINSLDLEKVKESLTGIEDSDVKPRSDIAEDSQPSTIKQAAQLKEGYVANPKVFK